jgi:hypothetical protein
MRFLDDHETNKLRFIMKYLITLLVILLFASLAAQPTLAGAYPWANELNSTGNRFLLLDSRVVAEIKNAKLTLGTVKKHEANPLFGEDQPWEKRFDNFYGNVIFDTEDGLYKCWYSPFIVDLSAKGMTLEDRKKPYVPPKDNVREMGICYAVSKDGIHWEKPNLGQVEYDGSKENNIIIRGPHGAGVFKDEQETNHERRYKLISWGLNVRISKDGLKWSPPLKLEGVNVAGDTHNNAFWAPTLNQYVVITRTWDKGVRQVARTESEDFVHWSPAEVVLLGTTTNLQPYAMTAFYYGGVYLGLVAIHEQPPVDRVWVELAWSPDTKEWHRVAEGSPFIPLSETPLAYDYGCIYACANPVFLKNEIRLYYGGSDYTHGGWRNGSLCLATLRPDGFAGYEPVSKNESAIVTTSAFDYLGPDIQISADVAKGGSIVASVVDGEGNVISKASPIAETVTDGRLKFQEPLKPGKIRLQFEIKDAKLYSFRSSEKNRSE